MTHIHNHTSTKVRAWRFLKTEAIPVWVTKNFHDLGDGRRTHRSGYSVPEGDWIIDIGSTITVLTDAEFTKHFTACP